MLIFVIKYLPAEAMALFPFVLLKERNMKHNTELINHERIHHVQQIELLFIPFYLLYLIFYLVNLLRYRNHYTAYRHIPFERESFKNQQNLDYLRKRPFWAWLAFITKED